MVSDRRGSIVHPLVYPHPKTGRSTLCFHTGMTSAFVFDYSDISAVQFTSQEVCKLVSIRIRCKLYLPVPYSNIARKAS